MLSTIQFSSRNDFLRRFTSLHREEQKNLNIINDFVLKIVKDRRKMFVEGKVKEEECIMDYYFLTPIDGQFLTDEEILTEVNTMILGMHDTTQATSGFLFYNLAKHPDVQDKVYEELKVVLKDDPMIEIAEDELNQMTYTDAVIKETLRMYPIVPYFGRKLRSEITIGEHTYPKDVEIVIAPYLMCRNPKYFDNPLVFNPDRFHGVETMPLAYTSFGIGAKKCLGYKMAIRSLKIVVAKAILNVKFSLPPDFGELTLLAELILKSRDKVPLIGVRRHPRPVA